MMAIGNEDISAKIGLKQKRRVPWLWIGVVALVVVAAGGWFFRQGEQAGGARRFVTEPVSRADIEVTVSAVGSVEPTGMFEISSELSGTIRDVLVDFNDRVEVGTVLARLDTAKLDAQHAVQEASLKSAVAQVALAKASLEEARETFVRGLELKARGVESESTFTAQEAAYQRAQAQHQSALAAQDLAQANLELVEVDLEKSYIYSPVDGIVLDLDVDPGQIVAASLSAPTLFTVAEDLTRMELQVYVDEADIGRVAVGQGATFTVDAYDERSFPAKIFEVRFASETIDGVVSYMALLSVDNSDQSLRPGMTASADIAIASVDNVLVVPNAALRFVPETAESSGQSSGSRSGLVGMVMPTPPGGGNRAEEGGSSGNSVFVLRENTPVRVSVQVGESNDSFTEIVSGDLAEGDMVITDAINAD